MARSLIDSCCQEADHPSARQINDAKVKSTRPPPQPVKSKSLHRIHIGHKMNTTDAPSNTDIFAEVRKTFLTSLTPSEQAQYLPCSSLDDLISQLKSLTKKHALSSRTSRLLEVTKRFTEKLCPFFQVVTNVYTGAHPGSADVVWGGLLLVAKVSFFVSCLHGY